MFEIIATETFKSWFASLRDQKLKDTIRIRLNRIERGNFGRTRTVHGGVSEIKIDYGPGYRLYYTRRRGTVVILLMGGSKKSQSRDIRRAQDMEKTI